MNSHEFDPKNTWLNLGMISFTYLYNIPNYIFRPILTEVIVKASESRLRRYESEKYSPTPTQREILVKANPELGANIPYRFGDSSPQRRTKSMAENYLITQHSINALNSLKDLTLIQEKVYFQIVIGCIDALLHKDVFYPNEDLEYIYVNSVSKYFDSADN